MTPLTGSPTKGSNMTSSELGYGTAPSSVLRAPKIYPDAAHGFLFQYAREFAADISGFLGDNERSAS